MIRTALRMASGFALALGCTIAAAAGPAFPNKEIRVLIAFPPGGPTDAIGRVIFRRVSIELGQPVIIENRPGAGGSIASQFVAKSKPDGYTLLFASSSFSTTPELYRRDDLVPSKAFKMVGCAATVPMLLLVPNNLKVDTPQQFLSLIKDKPDTLFMGSSGNGAIDHLTGMYMSQALDAKFQHVPYAGSGPALMDLVAGNVQFLFTGAFSTALPFIKDHRIKAIAVTSAKRSSVLPDVPTLDETIMKGFDGAPGKCWRLRPTRRPMSWQG